MRGMRPVGGIRSSCCVVQKASVVSKVSPLAIHARRSCQAVGEGRSARPPTIKKHRWLLLKGLGFFHVFWCSSSIMIM